MLDGCGVQWASDVLPVDTEPREGWSGLVWAGLVWAGERRVVSDRAAGGSESEVGAMADVF